MVDFGQRSQELERPRDPVGSALTWRRLALDLEWATPRNPSRSALRLRRLVDEHGLEKALEWEWAANSYSDDCLDVYGVCHPLVYDTRLRDLAAPWVEDQAMPETGATTRVVSFRPRSSTRLEDVVER